MARGKGQKKKSKPSDSGMFGKKTSASYHPKTVIPTVKLIASSIIVVWFFFFTWDRALCQNRLQDGWCKT